MTMVLGTDGTERGTAGVEWAAAEAQRRRTPLRILHSFDWDREDSRFDIGNEYIDVERQLAEAVVAAAYDHARAAAPDVDVETAWLDDLRRAGIPTPQERSAEQARLDEQPTPWRDKYPDVLIETVLTHKTIAAILVAGSRNAQLIVVGSRGHGELTGTVLRSVGLRLLHDADCPVMIVRGESVR